ncbi:MAG: hypothetical protein AB7C97_10255 [Oscillospiraceae bacterium]
MDRTEELMYDLARQKKRLEDMRAWKSSEALVRAQTAAVESLEKQIEEIGIGENPARKPELEIDDVMEPIDPASAQNLREYYVNQIQNREQANDKPISRAFCGS